MSARLASLARVLGASLATLACGSFDPTGAGGEGALAFTTWGEAYIEDGIPPASPGAAGFVDGWTVKYQKFLVNFEGITVADAKGEVAAALGGSLLFDNHRKGVKSVVRFPNVEARAWESVGYRIAPVTADTALSDSVTEADKQLMLEGGYSLYVEATATKADVSKRWAWGFAIGTSYQDCRAEQGGRDEYGVVVTSGRELEVQLTTHGDHLYYDRLQASTNPAVVTALRFDALAAADTDGDGELTLAELDAAPLQVRLYDPSGFGATTHGAFVKTLARTIGHFRGEGECEASAIE